MLRHEVAEIIKRSDNGDPGAPAAMIELVAATALTKKCRKPVSASRIVNLVFGSELQTVEDNQTAQDKKAFGFAKKNGKAADPSSRWHVALLFTEARKDVLPTVNSDARKTVASQGKKITDLEAKTAVAVADAAEAKAGMQKIEAGLRKVTEELGLRKRTTSSPTVASPTKRRGVGFAARDFETFVGPASPRVGAERRIGADGKTWTFREFIVFYNGDVRTAERAWKLCTVDRSSIPTVADDSDDSDSSDSGESDSAVRQAMYASMSPSREVPGFQTEFQ